MKTASSGNGRRKYLAEINVTPLVDVMLVLLIIFMVTAPMMTKGIEVKLPETEAGALPQKKEPLTITVTRNGDIFMEDMIIQPDLLQPGLQSLQQEGNVSRVLLKADAEVRYGRVAEVMTAIRKSGITAIGLVTRPVSRE